MSFFFKNTRKTYIGFRLSQWMVWTLRAADDGPTMRARTATEITSANIFVTFFDESFGFSDVSSHLTHTKFFRDTWFCFFFSRSFHTCFHVTEWWSDGRFSSFSCQNLRIVFDRSRLQAECGLKHEPRGRHASRLTEPLRDSPRVLLQYCTVLLATLRARDEKTQPVLACCCVLRGYAHGWANRKEERWGRRKKKSRGMRIPAVVQGKNQGMRGVGATTPREIADTEKTWALTQQWVYCSSELYQPQPLNHIEYIALFPMYCNRVRDLLGRKKLGEIAGVWLPIALALGFEDAETIKVECHQLGFEISGGHCLLCIPRLPR